MKVKKESWLDGVTPQDIEQMLKRQYNFYYNGEYIERLKDWYCNIGPDRVDIYVKYQEDWEEYEESLIYTEFNDGSIDIKDKLKLSLWIELLEKKNKGRKINGKTYTQARAEWLENQIEEHYQAQYKKINREKEELLFKVKKIKEKEIENFEELGEE